MLNTNLIPQKKSQYIVLDGIVPNNVYGESSSTILKNRIYHLFYDKNLFTRSVDAVKLWKDKNKERIATAFINDEMNSVLIPYPSKPITLQEAINKEFIRIEPKQKSKTKSLSPTDYIISIPTNKATKEKIDLDFLTNNLSKEILITIAVSLTRASLELLNINHNLYIILQWSFIIGIVRGSAETTTNALSEENASLFLYSLPLNCIIEILTETSTAISFYLLNGILPLVLLYALRGFVKYFFEQLIQGYYNLMNITDLSLEMLKSSLKETSIAYLSATFGRQVLFGRIFGRVLGGCLGTLLSVSLINVLIDQAFSKLSFKA